MNVVRRGVVDSTNEVAKTLIAEGAEPWTVVVAEKQVQGKGRFGRSWSSPRGGLYLSVLLQDELSRLPILALAAGLATAEALEALGLQPRLKWPNDVLLGDRKVAGILVEGIVGAETYWAIIGIGVNTNVTLEALPEGLREGATTLRDALGEKVDNEALLKGLLDALTTAHPAVGKEEAVSRRYREICSTLGRKVKVETADGMLEGKAVDVDASGFLRLQTKEGVVEVAEGTIVEGG